MVEETPAGPASPVEAAPVEAPTATTTEAAPVPVEAVKAAAVVKAPSPEPEVEEEDAEVPFEAELACKEVYLSRVAVQVWFPEPAWVRGPSQLTCDSPLMGSAG
jgi:hypothetical protein